MDVRSLQAARRRAPERLSITCKFAKTRDAMLPDGWHRSTLGEIARITSGGTPDRAEPSYWDGTIPWVTTSEIHFNTITDTAEKISAAGLKNSSAKLFPAGTLLMAMYGQGKTRGQVAKLGIEAATSQNSAAILFGDGYDPGFYYHFLAWQYESIRDFGHAGGISHLNAGLLKQIPVPVAPRGEQHRVAILLDTWDKAIATTERLLANNREQKQVLMRLLLAAKRRVRSAKGDWRHADLDQFFERVTHKNTENNANVLTISGQYGLIGQREFFSKTIASENLATYTVLGRGEFAYNRSYSAGYPMGAIKPLERYDMGIVSSLYLCFRLRSPNQTDYDFFRHYFEAGLLNEQIAGIAQEGARNHGLLNVSVVDFFKLRLHVPPPDERLKIAEVLNTAEAEERSWGAQLERLQREKRALMSALLTGKRRVRLPSPAAAAA
jgi:type I restriction enzyme, S subunit